MKKKQNLGVLKFCSLGTGRVADRKIHALPYMVKFGSSASNGVCKNRREPPKLGSAEAPFPCRRGAWLTQ